MGVIDSSLYDADLKRMWADSIEILTYDDNPLLGNMPKDATGGGGDYIKVPVVYSGNIGLSANWDIAQANAAIAKSAAFLVPPVTYYGMVDVPNSAIKQTSGDKKGFKQLLTLNLKTLITQFAHRIAQLMYGSGWGDVGTVASFVANTSFTFTLRSSVVGIEVGDQLTSASAQSAATLDAGTMTVTAVDRDTGTVTVTGMSAAMANGRFIFHAGDRDSGGINRLVIAGLQAYLRTSTAAPGTLFSMDRNPDPTRLAGTFITMAGGNLPTIFRLVSRIKENGGKAKDVYLSTQTYVATVLELNGNVRYLKESDADSDSATFSYEGIKVAGPGGRVTIYCDPNAPDGIAFALERDSWELWLSGNTVQDGKGVIAANNPDGTLYVQRDASPNTECRLDFQGNLTCMAPGHNGIATGLNVSA